MKTEMIVPSKSNAKVYKCCKPIFYKHQGGWDIYSKSDCTKYGKTFVPNWFDCAIVEDAETLADAVAQLKDLHPAGFCMVNA